MRLVTYSRRRSGARLCAETADGTVDDLTAAGVESLAAPAR